MRLYKHYSEVDMNEWRWPNFTPAELASRREGELGIDEKAMDTLQLMRNYMGVPLKITSAYRSKKHNDAVGGAKSSQHLKAKAFDIRVAGHDPARLLAAGEKAGFTSFGFYEKTGFIHFDIRTRPATWGKRWFSKRSFSFTNVQNKPEVQVQTPSRPTTGKISLLSRIFAALKRLFS